LCRNKTGVAGPVVDDRGVGGDAAGDDGDVHVAVDDLRKQWKLIELHRRKSARPQSEQAARGVEDADAHDRGDVGHETDVRAEVLRVFDVRQVLRAQPDEEVDKLQRLAAQQRELERQLEAFKLRLATAQTQDYFSQVREVAGVRVLALCLDNFDRKALRSFVDTAKDRLGSGVVVVGSIEDDKAVLVAGVTRDLTQRLSAGILLGQVAALMGGKGGGRPDMAQGGGPDAAKLPEAIARVPEFVAALAQAKE